MWTLEQNKNEAGILQVWKGRVYTQVAVMKTAQCSYFLTRLLKLFN